MITRMISLIMIVVVNMIRIANLRVRLCWPEDHLPGQEGDGSETEPPTEPPAPLPTARGRCFKSNSKCCNPCMYIDLGDYIREYYWG